LGIPSTALEIMIYILFLAWIIGLRNAPFFVIPAKAGIHYYDKPKPFSQGLISKLILLAAKWIPDKFLRRCLEIFWNDTKISFKKNAMLNTGIILLFLGIIISTAFSSDIRTSLGVLKGWFFDPFLFFIVFINIVKKREHVFWPVKIWLASGAAVSLIGIFYLLNNDLTFDGRLRAFFLSPNHLAMYLSPAFLIAVWFLLETGNHKPNPLLSEEGQACLPDRQGWLKYWEMFKKQITKIFVIPSLRRGIPLILLSKLASFKGFLNRYRSFRNDKKEHFIIQNNYKLLILLIILIPLYFTYSYGAFLGLLAGALYLVIKNIYSLPPRHSLRLGTAAEKKTLRAFSPQSLPTGQAGSAEEPACRQTGLRQSGSSGKNIYRLGLIVLLFFGLIFLSSNKFNQIINSSDRSSFHSRLMIWSSAGEIIKDNPFFGIGPGTFQETYLSYADRFSEPYLEWAVPQPHNIFLAFYLQTGLIGFAGFILILFWFFHANYKLSRRSPCLPDRQALRKSLPAGQAGLPVGRQDCGGAGIISQYPNILISLMIYILVHGLVDATYWKNDLSLMFWLIIGLNINLTKIIKNANMKLTGIIK